MNCNSLQSEPRTELSVLRGQPSGLVYVFSFVEQGVALLGTGHPREGSIPQSTVCL